jgi:4-hydroxybenzoyl-CoA reductase subunit beta
MLDTRCHFFNQSYFWRRSLGYCLKAEGDLCHVIPKIKRDGVLVDNRFECVATNSSDMLPVLIVLGAELELVSAKGRRTVKASEFYCYDGIKRFHKENGEILAAIRLPASARSVKAGYKKLRPRESWDFPVLGVAASVAFDGSRNLSHFSLCVNAVDTHPAVFDDFVRGYVGKRLDEAAINAIAEHVQKSVQPKLNVPMEPGYRKKMAGVFTRRLLAELAG